MYQIIRKIGKSYLLNSFHLCIQIQKILISLYLTIKRGETIFICGGNGSGKTTFIKVLLGLYSATKGDVYLDNNKVVDTRSSNYRSLFSSIFSDSYVFEHFLTKSGECATNDIVNKYLHQFKLDDVVDVKNGKLTNIELSSGQRKRIAMIQALLDDASIYIFDEWPAEQDPVFRNYFYDQLLPELKSKHKTIIVISHDERYFDLADKLYRFYDGQVRMENHKGNP
ncbi:MAG: ATP-binding cassette domain-containing protein [Pseudomonadota bacterium]